MNRKKLGAAPNASWRARLATVVATLVSSCVVASSGAAKSAPEPPPGAPIPKALDQLPIDETRVVLAGFAKCNVGKNPALAREFILSSRDYYLDERFRSLTLPECLVAAMQGATWGTAQLQLTMPSMRYTIAEVLVNRDLKRFNPDLVRTAAPLAELTVDPAKTMKLAEEHEKTPAEAAKNLAAAQTDVALVKYGECVVRADPHGSQRLLSSKINSDEEGAALTALLPAFATCLDEGHQFAGNRLSLRGIVAFNYYRLAYATQVASATKP
jgi:hypothetical protein